MGSQRGGSDESEASLSDGSSRDSHPDATTGGCHIIVLTLSGLPLSTTHHTKDSAHIPLLFFLLPNGVRQTWSQNLSRVIHQQYISNSCLSPEIVQRKKE
ncbi:hypothetical protein AOLI_G00088000 [Acnodon oligacanthus]